MSYIFELLYIIVQLNNADLPSTTGSDVTTICKFKRAETTPNWGQNVDRKIGLFFGSKKHL